MLKKKFKIILPTFYKITFVLFFLGLTLNQTVLNAQFQYPPYIPIDTLTIATEEFTPKEIIMLSLNLLGDDGDFSVISGPNNGYISDLLQFELDSMRLDKALGGYIPNYGYTGEDIISYESINSYGSSGEKYILINIYDPAHPPPTIPDSLTISSDLSQAIELELNSTDVDYDDATFEITAGPFLGTISNIEQFQNTGNNDRALVTYQSTFGQSDMFTYIAKDNDGSSSTGIVFIKNQTVGIGSNYQLSIVNYKLEQNYPNPFNPTTKIHYHLPVKTMHASSLRSAEIVIYNAMGQSVWSTIVGARTSCPTPDATNHGSIQFNGSKFNSGVYYYSLIIDGKKMDTKSMILIK